VSTSETLHPWRPFRFDVTATPAEPDWLVDGLMARGMITMLSGDTSAGKSFVSLALAMAVLEGDRTWLDCDVAGPGRVLVIENEMPGYDVEDRLRGFGIRNEHWDRLAYLDKSQAVALDDSDQASDLHAVVESFAPDLVILDTLFSLAPGIDHNSNGAAAAFYRDVLRPLARTTSLLLLHHENKPGEHGRGKAEYAATGARAWAHQADRHLTLAATGTKEVKCESLANGHTRSSYALELDSGKTRGPLKPKLSLSLDTVADAGGRTISTEVRVVAERQRKGADDAMADRALAFLREQDAGRAKLAEIAASLQVGPNDGRVRRALNALIERGLIVKSGHGIYEIAE
jgi:ketosteroid isomerase-like protein